MESDTRCAICYEEYAGNGPAMDGPQNYEYSENNKINCNHWLCVNCWQNIYDKSLEHNEPVRCPFCREDISNMFIENTTYNDYDSGDDSDEDSSGDECCNEYCKYHYVEKFLEDIKDDKELLHIFQEQIQNLLQE
jgi:hypothetical protein